ncbi:MAG: hypothetical protein QM539_04485 [Alphaproteobacteria bacterium]|nr:hypothetical protein [Alphaproteobacteria bacterium]
MKSEFLKITKSTKKKIFIIFITFVIAIFVLFIYQIFNNNNKNFFKFKDKHQYSPLSENNNGFYGKVNYYLNQALLDTNNVKYDVSKLDNFYKRLKFYYPTDTSNYLISIEDIRLIDFIPNPNDKTEQAFYVNSYFKNIIEKQNSNLSKKYFNFKWNKVKNKIIQIKIDTTLLNFSLLNESWKGTIKLNDPFKDIDRNVKYISSESFIIPIFSSDMPSIDFEHFETKDGYYIIDANRRTNLSLDEMQNLFDSSTFKKDRPLLFNYTFNTGTSEEYSLRFLNSKGKIYIKTQNIDIDFYDKQTKKSNTNDNKMLEIDSNFNLIKIHVKLRKEGSLTYNLYLSNISPLNIASKPINEGIAGSEFINIDKKYLDLFTSQQIHQIESGFSSKDSVKSIELSTNILLSKYLEEKIKKYIVDLENNSIYTKRKDDIFEMSICLMDIATGEIISTPFYSNEFDKNNQDELTEKRNFNLIKHDIASTFKPLLSFAASLKYPSLSQFELNGQHTKLDKDTGSTILGYKTKLIYGLDKTINPPIPNPLFWPIDKNNQPINRINFLGKSHDNYPITMAMLALTTNQDSSAYSTLINENLDNEKINNLYNLNGKESVHIKYDPLKKRIVFKDISNSKFIRLMANLYDVKAKNDDAQQTYLTSENYMWEDLHKTSPDLYSLYADVVSLGTDQFGNANSDVSDFKKFERFVLGQGDNQWTNLKLAEAYSRVLSKRKVKANFLKNLHSSEPIIFKNLANFVNNNSAGVLENSWSKFLKDWRDAVINKEYSLLNTAYNNFRTAAGINNINQFYFYCKTGTPQDNDEHSNNKVFKKGKQIIYWDEGVFAFGITNTNEISPSGIVGVVYIKHLSLQKINGGVSSTTARDFFQPDVFNKILFFNHNRILK